eukprot:CAMPEP_0194167102 /NCGR_PEP_ID=MMETSP0154-20130528/2504_1 /TAXON_ID=1049557 /ORGANISM="Thalassiothrix antarctica, Strain L6-D1" /LENGTH=170 /DNA_ID=CAMNT_0038877937 /DNA_START=28 /DNA_END=537 /DNA_ORIENTATION=+
MSSKNNESATTTPSVVIDDKKKNEEIPLSFTEVSGMIETNIRMPLKAFIKSGVDMTNTMLFALEESTDGIRKPVLSATTMALQEGKVIGSKASNLYSHRREYSSQLIVGAGLLGGLIGLRRGRISAVTFGSIGSFLTYLGTYEVDLNEFSSKIFNQKVDLNENYRRLFNW